jgi:hemerythrin-like domain-containing protein
MKITDRLKVEHGVFLQQLRTLEKLAQDGASREVLLAVMSTIAGAEERHARMEDKVLYPALVRALGERFPLLAQLAAEHTSIRELSAEVRGNADAASVCRYADALRKHMESEIHALFVVAEEFLGAPELEAMCNWDVEHVFEEAGEGALWAERWLQ